MNKETITSILFKKGFISSKEVSFEPLTGGVSSDIYLLKDAYNKYVVKKALSRLKVEDEWYADISRNDTEQEFILYIQKFLPEAVPNILYRDKEHHFFLMEYLNPSFKNWKEQLLQGEFNPVTTREAARMLSAIHHRSWHDKEAKTKFNTTDNFKSLRIEPYLITTGNRHPDLKKLFHKEAKRLESQRRALVHGDFSPKNVMVKSDRIVLLDHEVAWFGDPAFDIAFLLNHLYLKMLLHSNIAFQLPDLTRIVWETYFAGVSEDQRTEMEPRAGRLLLMLMLARVDGKSPVEYLGEERKKFVRSFVYDLLPKKVFNQRGINSKWRSKLKKYSVED